MCPLHVSVKVKTLPVQALLADPAQLRLSLLRHLTRGAVLSNQFPTAGSTPLLTGAGERLTLTAFPNRNIVSSSLAVGNFLNLDNRATNGVIHVIDIVL